MPKPVTTKPKNTSFSKKDRQPASSPAAPRAWTEAQDGNGGNWRWWQTLAEANPTIFPLIFFPPNCYYILSFFQKRGTASFVSSSASLLLLFSLSWLERKKPIFVSSLLKILYNEKGNIVSSFLTCWKRGGKREAKLAKNFMNCSFATLKTRCLLIYVAWSQLPPSWFKPLEL